MKVTWWKDRETPGDRFTIARNAYDIAWVVRADAIEK